MMRVEIIQYEAYVKRQEGLEHVNETCRKGTGGGFAYILTMVVTQQLC